MEANLRNRVAIVSVGDFEIGKVPHMTGFGLNAQAAMLALNETGLKPSDIDGLLTAYSMTEPYFMLGSVMCEYLGLKPTFNASMVVGGASASYYVKTCHRSYCCQASRYYLMLCWRKSSYRTNPRSGSAGIGCYRPSVL